MSKEVLKDALKCMTGEIPCNLCHYNDIAEERDTCCINVVAEETLEYIEELESKIKEYQDKIENGTLIELPCKVGDKVWLIYENQVEIAEIWRIVLTPTYNEFKWFIPYNKIQPKDIGSFKTNEIGKTVFLTKTEAEAKFKEIQNEQ